MYSRTLQPRDNGAASLKYWKNCQSRILYSMYTPFKVKIFSFTTSGINYGSFFSGKLHIEIKIGTIIIRYHCSQALSLGLCVYIQSRIYIHTHLWTFTSILISIHIPTSHHYLAICLYLYICTSLYMSLYTENHEFTVFPILIQHYRFYSSFPPFHICNTFSDTEKPGSLYV